MEYANKTLSDVGEREFIHSIRELMPGNGGIFTRSVGDDCLVTATFGNDNIISTIDTFVDSVHFNTNYFSYEQIGHRCAAASVSDIAAMSGKPKYILLSLSMPPDMMFDDAVALFSGMQETAVRYGCPISGGETTSSPGPLTVTLTVIGTADPERTIMRSGASPGDGIYISGTIGDAMAGLMTLERRLQGFAGLKRKFVSPEALVDFALALTESYSIHAMIDVSDGLAVDLGHICEESKSGAELKAEMIPLSDEFLTFAAKTGIDPVEFALSSGEEFELLFTANESQVQDRFSINNHTVTRIGTITDASDGLQIRIDPYTLEALIPKGYEHFKS